MAATEMWDYLSNATPDYAQYLSVTPQSVVEEEADYRVEIHEADDGSEERISFANVPIYYLKMQWNGITEADSGTIWDLWSGSTKARGMYRSFIYSHFDNHDYVIRFAQKITRKMIAPGVHAYPVIRFKVLGIYVP